MVEKITADKQLLAIIIFKDFNKTGIHFFTPDNFSQQLAHMRRPKGYKIEPHIHHVVHREISLTQEVLFIRKGRIRVDFYDDNKNYLESRILEAGDVILLAAGGHGFEMLEESEMIEVKQGPYYSGYDKIVFTPKDKISIKLPDK